MLDNGFTFGDSVYETLRTYGGRPFHLDRHLRRLRASADRLRHRDPADDAELARGAWTRCWRAPRTPSPTSASS